jgi:hypothetical protein
MANRLLSIQEVKDEIERLLTLVCKDDPPKVRKQVRKMITQLIGV